MAYEGVTPYRIGKRPGDRNKQSDFLSPQPRPNDTAPPILPTSLPSAVTFHPTGSCNCLWRLVDVLLGPCKAVFLLVFVFLRIPFVILGMLLPTCVKMALWKCLFRCGYPLYLTRLGKGYWNMALASMYSGGGSPRPHTVDIKPTRLSACTIWPVPIMADNYAYILVDHRTGQCAIVDPGAAVPLSLACFQLGLVPRYVLLTHAHHDHAGGLDELLHQFPQIEVYVHEEEAYFGPEPRKLHDKQIFMLGATRITVIHTPCHTPGSLVFAIAKAVPAPVMPGLHRDANSGLDNLKNTEAILTGDTLFLGGTGAPFHGTDALLYNSLLRLEALPNSCLVFPGHEYTEMLRWFACWVDPSNENALILAHEAQAQRTLRRPTVPGILGMERKVNPWLRADQDGVVAAVEERLRQYHTVCWCWRQWDCCNRAPRAWFDLGATSAAAHEAKDGRSSDYMTPDPKQRLHPHDAATNPSVYSSRSNKTHPRYGRTKRRDLKGVDGGGKGPLPPRLRNPNRGEGGYYPGLAAHMPPGATTPLRPIDHPGKRRRYMPGSGGGGGGDTNGAKKSTPALLERFLQMAGGRKRESPPARREMAMSADQKRVKNKGRGRSSPKSVRYDYETDDEDNEKEDVHSLITYPEEYATVVEDIKGGGDFAGVGKITAETRAAAVYQKLRFLQPLFETLLPARHFHLQLRRRSALAVQMQTDSMVWADGHIYLTSDIFSREASLRTPVR